MVHEHKDEVCVSTKLCKWEIITLEKRLTVSA